ncbi:hypothetical protein ACFWM7_10845 [Streptomyces sp. NPDC058375]|uniref:hypothetical protein n=1 Tax=Streptomyces sp. NPDC058375 TaxID=3346467 RepID=UPI003657EA14
MEEAAAGQPPPRPGTGKRAGVLEAVGLRLRELRRPPSTPAAHPRAEMRVLQQGGAVNVDRMNVTGPSTTATARATSSPVAAA